LQLLASLLLSYSVVTLLQSAIPSDKPVEYRCIRWAWTGDVYSRKVYCLEWKKVERK